MLIIALFLILFVLKLAAIQIVSHFGVLAGIIIIVACYDIALYIDLIDSKPE